MEEIGIVTVFLAGIASFVTPCIFPLVPAYITYITGLDLETLQEGTVRRSQIFLNSVLFVLGFSLIFMLLVIPVSMVGNILLEHQVWIQRIAGIIIIVFGLHIAGIINIGILNVEKKLHLSERPGGYIGSLVIGVTFAAGWSPCLSPILTSIILIASTESVSTAVLLMGVYSLGLAIPFLVAGLAINWFLDSYKGIAKHTKTIMTVSGLLLVFVGGLMFLNLLQRVFALILPG
jgi:cytochrome c-type biogenesis protein